MLPASILRRIGLLSFVLAWAVAAYAIAPVPIPAAPFGAPAATSTPTNATPSTASLYPVVHVVDGDTIDVLQDGEKVRVRLIGINAPESADPRRSVQCFGMEASQEMKRLLTGQSVRLEQDPSQDTRDKYGRLLAYVFLPDGTNVNKHMIAAGYAHEYTYRLPYRYQDEFRAAQREARDAGRGLWKTGVCAHDNGL